MKNYLVTTFDGKKIKRSLCVRKKGKYYRIRKDIFKVKYGETFTWLTIGDPNLLYDVDDKKYIHSYYRKEFIIYDIDKKLTTNVFDCNLRECFVNGEYGLTTLEHSKQHLILDKKTGIYNDGNKPSFSNSIFYRSVQYSYERNKHLFTKFKEKSNYSSLNNLSSGYSFGVELETSSGTIPSNELLANGLLAVRDGSTPNYEYVTVPLLDITSLLPIIESVNNHCTFDITTSLHIHLGNVPTDQKFISTFYRFMTNIQDDVFKMFPNYKADNSAGIKRHNYTQKLPKKIKFNTILNFLNNDKPCDAVYTGERLNHYADIARTSKWNVSSRYYWCNIIPLVFYPSRTIEFRIHQGTFNKYKIIYWLLMCIAFIKYVEKTQESKQVSIKHIFNTIYGYGKVANALYAHYLDMRDYYSNYDEHKDLSYIQDIKDDPYYIPKIKLF